MLKTIIKYLFLLTIFFPYIKIIPIEEVGDTQPVALVLGVILFFYYVIMKRETIIKPFIYLFVVWTLAIIVFLVIPPISINGFRSLIGYTSLFFLSFSSYIFLKQTQGVPDKFIKFVIIIWGTVGLIQAFIYPEFLSFLLNRFSNIRESGRGVLSLAPEPSYFGTVGIFLLFYSVFQLRSYFYSFFLLFQIIFLAKSSLAIFVLGLTLIIYLFTYKKFISGGILVALMLLLGSYMINSTYFANTRMVHLLSNTINGDIIFETDESANSRFSAIYFPLKGFIDHLGVPGGLSTYSDYVIDNWRGMSFFEYVGLGRIMSGYGAALYEMGIFGLLISIVFVMAIRNYFKQNKKMGIVISISFTLFMFTPVPLASPYVSFFYGYLIYYTRKNEIIANQHRH